MAGTPRGALPLSAGRRGGGRRGGQAGRRTSAGPRRQPADRPSARRPALLVALRCWPLSAAPNALQLLAKAVEGQRRRRDLPLEVLTPLPQRGRPVDRFHLQEVTCATPSRRSNVATAPAPAGTSARPGACTSTFASEGTPRRSRSSRHCTRARGAASGSPRNPGHSSRPVRALARGLGFVAVARF